MLMKSEHRKELVSEIRSLAQSQGLNTVFTTFLEITANSLAAQTDPENAEKREQRYQEMASTMTPELLSSYARMLALLFLTVREYRDDPCDILGGIYHELNLNNEWNGQYFTPDDVCRLMAQITLPSDELSANDGPITINEPTCGSGTMVIGAIWAMQRKEILQWLKNAGVRLTVAELVYLTENGIKPTQDLLYTDNRQRLIEQIYTVDTIADNLLETQMETAKCRDAVVQSLMRLLKKKLVLVL